MLVARRGGRMPCLAASRALVHIRAPMTTAHPAPSSIPRAPATRERRTPLALSRLLLVLLVFIPLALAAEWLHWGGLVVFIFSGLAIVPLAGLMGESTERLASRLGAGVGALLNATFGNAAELIIAL